MKDYQGEKKRHKKLRRKLKGQEKNKRCQIVLREKNALG